MIGDRKGKQLFRAESVEEYFHNSEQITSLQDISQKRVIFLWLLLALLLSGSMGFWFLRIPVYAVGVAAVVENTSISPDGPDDGVLAAFLPATTLPFLVPGQLIYWQSNLKNKQSPFAITKVLAEPMNPADVIQRFSLPENSAVQITQPVAVVYASLGQQLRTNNAAHNAEALPSIKLKIGSQRILSFLF